MEAWIFLLVLFLILATIVILTIVNKNNGVKKNSSGTPATPAVPCASPYNPMKLVGILVVGIALFLIGYMAIKKIPGKEGGQETGQPSPSTSSPSTLPPITAQSSKWKICFGGDSSDCHNSTVTFFSNSIAITFGDPLTVMRGPATAVDEYTGIWTEGGGGAFREVFLVKFNSAHDSAEGEANSIGKKIPFKMLPQK